MALAFATTDALASSSVPQQSIPERSVTMAVADSSATMAAVPDSKTPRSFPSNEAGVRRAAAQGPAALRHYIFRTRMIYNDYFWDFAKDE